MDPSAVTKPDESGYVEVSSGISLHYELYSPPSSNVADEEAMYDELSSRPEQRQGHQLHKSRVLLIMGAFATKAHFASTARFLADEGYEVLIYDHRGVGGSGMQLHTHSIFSCKPLHVKALHSGCIDL